jgi:hypothetical protein
MKKKNKRIYLSGRYTGIMHDDAMAIFEKYESQLISENEGCEVVNPLKLGIPLNTPWIEAMEICIENMATCNAIALIPNYSESRGARIELSVAKKCNFEIIYLT